MELKVKVRSLAGLGLAGVLALSACGAAPHPTEVGAVELTAGTLTAGAVPVPAGDPVLVIDGAERPNVGGALAFDLAALARAHTVRLEVFEPFLGRRVVFEGVPLADLVELAGRPAGASVMHTVALNDYVVDIPLSVLDLPGVVLATKADGVAIGLEDGGPIRIVIADDHPDASNQSYWNWSLASVELR